MTMAFKNEHFVAKYTDELVKAINYFVFNEIDDPEPMSFEVLEINKLKHKVEQTKQEKPRLAHNMAQVNRLHSDFATLTKKLEAEYLRVALENVINQSLLAKKVNEVLLMLQTEMIHFAPNHKSMQFLRNMNSEEVQNLISSCEVHKAFESYLLDRVGTENAQECDKRPLKRPRQGKKRTAIAIHEC